MLNKRQFEYILSLIPDDNEYHRHIRNEFIREKNIIIDKNCVFIFSELVDELFTFCSLHYGITKNELRMKNRQQPCVILRHVIMVVLREHGYSLNKIGGALHHHHATVCYALKNHNILMRYNNYSSYYNDIKEYLQEKGKLTSKK